MPDQHNQPANHTNGDIGATLNTVSEGERKHSPLIESFAKDAAAKSLLEVPRGTERVGVKVNLLGDFEAEAATDTSKSTSSDELFMPTRVNLHELGLRRSKRIAEQKSKVHKAHVTYGACAKQTLTMFALICSVGNYTMPSHRSSTNPTFTESLI